MTKKFLLLFLVLVLVSSCAWAFPKKVESSKPSLVESVKDLVMPPKSTESVTMKEQAPAPVVEELSPVTQTPVLAPVSETEPDKVSQELLSLLEGLNDSSRLTKGQLLELIYQLETIQSDFELVAQDSAVKDDIIAQIQETNAKQADDIAYIKGKYEKEIGTKFFANVGGVLGINDMMKPVLGVTGEMGLRFGKGLTLGVGAQYMLFEDWKFKPVIDLRKLTVTGSIGWEW